MILHEFKLGVEVNKICYFRERPHIHENNKLMGVFYACMRTYVQAKKRAERGYKNIWTPNEDTFLHTQEAKAAATIKD